MLLVLTVSCKGQYQSNSPAEGEIVESVYYRIWAIFQNKKGNHWFGSNGDGVFVFDGKNLKRYKTEDGLIDNTVRSIQGDQLGNVFIETPQGVSKYKITDDSDTLKYEKLIGIDSLDQNFEDLFPYFMSGISDDLGNLWMTTYSDGVWKYDGKRLLNFPVEYDGTEVLLITIHRDNSGVIWLGSDNVGVFKFNGKQFEKFEPKAK